MPSTLVHLAIGGLVAVALLREEFGWWSLGAVLAFAALPDVDTFIGLILPGSHRSLLHSLFVPIGLGVLLVWDVRREESLLVDRFSGHGARVGAVANLALAYMNPGNYDEGLRWLSSQLELAQENQDKQGMAQLHTNMGIVNFEKGDYEASQLSQEKGLALAEELGNKLLTAISIGCLGSVRERKGDFLGAMEHFRKDLALAEELGDPQGIAIAHSLLGELLSIMGQFNKAIPHVEKAHAISRELGYKKGIAKAVNTLGDIFYYKGELQKSLEYYDQAIELTREIGNKLVLGSSLAEKAIVLLLSGHLEESRKIFHEARSLALSLGNPDLLLEIELLGLQIARKEGKKEEVLQAIRKALPNAEGEAEKAAFHFLAFETEPNETDHEQALTRYRALFAQTPKFLYKKRISQLEQWRL